MIKGIYFEKALCAISLRNWAPKKLICLQALVASDAAARMFEAQTLTRRTLPPAVTRAPFDDLAVPLWKTK